MRAHVLIDLYVPARLGSPAELQFVARKAGLDAIVRVAEDASEAPTEAELTELAPDGPSVLPAVAVSGPGFRFACVVPDGAPDLESLEATGDGRLVQTAIAGLGGLALPAAPRRGPTGTVARRVWELDPSSKCGVVAMTVPGSLLGRDLDLEDTVIAERAVLGGSGPFATQIGRFASLLPLRRHAGAEKGLSSRELVDALSLGRGFAVELLPRASEGVIHTPDPNEGREDAEPEHKRRRRRRRKS